MYANETMYPFTIGDGHAQDTPHIADFGANYLLNEYVLKNVLSFL